MRFRERIHLSVAVGISLAVVVACDLDPLGLSKREIAAGYILERIEQNYFLIDADHPTEGGGVIQGVVLSIGWNDQVILVERHLLFSHEADGFVAIDLRTRTVGGSLTRSDVDSAPTLAGIELMHAAKAWESLLRK